MDKPCPAPEQTSQRLIWPIIDKGWRGRVILNGIVVDKERVFSSIYNPSTSSSVLLPQGLDAAMRKALCVFGVSWVCNTLRQAPTHKPTTLSPNANKLSTHTSASNKFRRQIACSQRHNILFINLLEEEGEDALFPKKKIFCLFGFCIAGNSALINLKWEEEVRCWLWLSLSLLFKLIWDLQLQQLTHRVNGNLKVLTSITSLNKLRRCSNKRRSCCLQIN